MSETIYAPGVTDRLTTATGLILRPWNPADAPAVRAAFTAPLMERQSGTPVGDLAAAERWIAERATGWASGSCYAWAVTDGSCRSALVGCVQVGAVERRHDSGWISYWTIPAAQGRGVATAAARAAADWAFAELGLYRLELGHRLDNPASCRVATRAGFTPEGIQRAKLRYGDDRYDVELHARLADDA